MANKKTVYIFGAGASAASNLPIQNNLIKAIFTLKEPKLNYRDSFLNTETIDSLIIDQYSTFEKSRRTISEFIISNFGDLDLFNFFMQAFSQLSVTDDNKHSDKSHMKESVLESSEYNIVNSWNKVYSYIKDMELSLEDIFTLLDKAIILKDFFIDYSLNELIDIQKKLNNCIVYTLHYKIKEYNSFPLYEELANYFVSKRLSYKQKDDNFSIITLNWDTLLDKHLFLASQNYNIKNNKRKILPDYCYYNYDMNNLLPSTLIKAKGYYNIKIMKLHGSINWLLCSNCGRLFTDYMNNISLYGMDEDSSRGNFKCNFCNDLNRKNSSMYVIITPTFIKSLNNIHLKSIWHNAYLDLSNASEIVFIGYSFPEADFELRYLLKKAIRPDANIKVILHQVDNPTAHLNCIKKTCSNESKILIEQKLNLPYKRYKSFFGNHNISFSYDGLEKAFRDGFF